WPRWPRTSRSATAATRRCWPARARAANQAASSEFWVRSSELNEPRTLNSEPELVGVMDERAGFTTDSLADWQDDWQAGRRLSTRGRDKIVLAAGMLSRSGEALD